MLLERNIIAYGKALHDYAVFCRKSPLYLFVSFEKCIFAADKLLIMGKTVFNPAQLELLKALEALNSEEDLLALKKTISEFFARRVDEEMNRLWESGEWNEDTLKELETAHDRTPYRQQ